MLIRKAALIFLIMIVCLEVVVRLTGVFKTYSESNYGYFINPFGQEYESHYWLWPPHEDVSIYNTEFTYQYRTSSLGLVDDEIDTSNTENILALIGDSFTHGQGAPQDSSMPRLFESILREDYPEIAVLNAGIPSGDLFYYSKLVEDFLLPVGIDRYIFVMNTSDIYDYMWFGGRERFQEDGTTRSRKSPWYMWLYEHSHSFRGIFHGILGFDHSYISRKKSLELKEESIAEFTNEFGMLRTMLEERDASFLIVIHPVARYFSRKNKSYVRDYAYLEGMAEAMQAEGYDIINMRPLLETKINEDNYLNYSWELDKHYNSKGYLLFAKEAAVAIETEFPEFLEPQAPEVSDSATTVSQNQP